jgi:hypothetical protein
MNNVIAYILYVCIIFTVYSMYNHRIDVKSATKHYNPQNANQKESRIVCMIFNIMHSVFCILKFPVLLTSPHQHTDNTHDTFGQSGAFCNDKVQSYLFLTSSKEAKTPYFKFILVNFFFGF